MLLRVDTQTKLASRQRGVRLAEFGLDERGLQNILFRSLDRLIPEDELLLVMQSRRWQEEPDIMALGADGTLFVFELKAWESRSANLLQVLRYGQVYGQYSYQQLDAAVSLIHSDGQATQGRPPQHLRRRIARTRVQQTPSLRCHDQWS